MEHNDPESLESWEISLCACGCFESDHTAVGCQYCPEDECGGYTYDETNTVRYVSGVPPEDR